METKLQKDLRQYRAEARLRHYVSKLGIGYVSTSDGRIFFDDFRGKGHAVAHELMLIDRELEAVEHGKA